ncbi:MAG TPA: CoA-binding protein, partial [bacterium]|nr:CoA-binding protein [bacterium]
WVKDKKIKVIGMYLEEFIDGKDFVDIAKAYPNKSIVILHPGETKESQKAISSHTGSLAGSSDTIRAGLSQAGIIQVDSVEKMFNMLKMLSFSKLPNGYNTAIITNAGGPGIITTDLVVKSGLTLADLGSSTKSKLRKILPAAASINNPIDVVGDARSDRYKAALEIVDKDKNVDSILVVLTPQIVTQIEDTAKLIINFSKKSTKPIIPIFIGGKYVLPGLERFYDNKVPAFQYSEEASYSLKKLTDYSIFKTESKKKPKQLPTARRKPKNSAVIKLHTKKSPSVLPQKVVQKLAREFNLDTPEEELVHSPSKALQFAKRVKYPVVIKASSEDVVHKTDFKALFLNINSDEELLRKYSKLKTNIKKKTKVKNPTLLIQEQILGGEELIIGANRDGDSKVYKDGKGFGHLLLFGKGGIYTEVYRDTAVGLIPLTVPQLEKLVDITNVSKIIRGTRGKKPLAFRPLIDTLKKVQTMLLTYPQIESIDLNPLILTEDRCIVVDIKIFLSK